ncbi:MAG TPA: alpha/beta hydrolase, partial [Steroidobacteraceae bacterium]|nr:alpha/beta hydrolase [Steroidobacteraceae bacterium]
VALTQRGHGDADRPETGYRPADFAADVDAFIEAMGLGPVVLVGHCMGATVAQRFAIDYPERLLGLVLLGSRASWHDQPEVEELGAYVSRMQDPVDPAFVREFQQGTVARPVSPPFLDTVVQESLKLPARVWRAVFVQGVQGVDHTMLLGAIEAPTLVLCGDRDTIAWSEQETLAARIRGAQRKTCPEAGHSMHWEDPAQFAEELVAFIRRVSRAGCLGQPEPAPARVAVSAGG